MKKYISKIILVIIIAAQVGYTTYMFSYVKTNAGSHSDETWSYGLANSYYEYESVYKKDFQERWIPGDMLKEYLTVQEGEQFAYGSVYYNSTHDMHPFLYDMVLHTVCSFFPNTFSWWFGYSLSIVFMSVTQVFLFLLTRKLTGSDAAALAACLLYGLGKGALHTFTLIRPYSMLVMLCVMYTYYSACCYEDMQEKGKFSLKHLTGATLTAGLAFMTHYYGIAYVGMFTAIFCAYQFCRKRLKAMFGYGFCMLAMLGIFFGIFSSATREITNYSQKGGMVDVIAFSRPVQIRMLLSYLFEYNYGFTIGFFPTAFWNITLPLVGFALAAAVALLIPFRDEPWFPVMLQKIKGMGIALVRFAQNANYIPVCMAGSCIAIYEMVARGIDVWLMGNYVMRYTCLAIPFVAVIVVVAVYTIWMKLLKKRNVTYGVIYVLVFLALLRVHVSTGYAYGFHWLGDLSTLESDTRGKNVLVADLRPERLPSDIAFFMPFLYEANAVYYTSEETMRESVQAEGFAGNEIDYVIIEMNIFQISAEDRAKLRMDEFVTGLPEESTEGEETQTMGVGDLQVDVGLGEKPNYDCTELIREITGDRPYETVGFWAGQKGAYYVLKF